MKRIKRPAAVLLAFGTAFALTPMAGAKEAACSPGSEPGIEAAACPGGPMIIDLPILDKAEYAPGATIRINLTQPKQCYFNEATSDGFVAAAKLTERLSNGSYQATGQAKAIATPGIYKVSLVCSWGLVVHQFTIKTPTRPAPGKPKPPIAKPKGAPDTGGGGTVISIG